MQTYQRAAAVYPLHSYHPRLVDGALLTRRERLEAFEDWMRRSVNNQLDDRWRNYLSEAELKDYDEQKQKPSIRNIDSPAAQRASMLRRAGDRRAWACQLYNTFGGRHWCGDGRPPWE